MNLQTRYLGIRLKNPLVAAASPLSKDLDGMKRLEDAGASALVLFSLFSEQVQGRVEVPAYNQFGNDPVEESHSFAPDPTAYNATPDQYLDLISRAKATLQIPLFASLNVTELDDWVSFVPHIQQAGADGLELNIYHIGADPDVSGEKLEKHFLEIVRAVRSELAIPLAVKVLPYFTSFSSFARSLSVAGADALVLFNWIYQPDIDLTNLESAPTRDLGAMNDNRLPLHWTSCLYGRVQSDIAVTGGLHNHVDVLKAVAAGGSVAMLATELLRRGIGRLSEIEHALEHWMERNGYESLGQLRGSMSKLRIADPCAYARLHYIKELQSYRPPARIVKVISQA